MDRQTIDLTGGRDDGDVVEYFIDDGKIVGITTEAWPFAIVRDQARDVVSFVHVETGESFGELNTKLFHYTLIAYLLATDSELMVTTAKNVLNDDSEQYRSHPSLKV